MYCLSVSIHMTGGQSALEPLILGIGPDTHVAHPFLHSIRSCWQDLPVPAYI